MSSQSPAATLYDSTGTALAVYNNTALVASQPAILFAGLDGYSSVTRYALMGANGQQSITETSNNVVVLSNATITNPGSDVYTSQLFGTQEIAIIVNVTAAPTGTGTPTLTFTVQEVDPGNGTTTYGNSASTTGITAAGVFTAVLNVTTSSAVKVSWTITGTTPSFTGVYVTLVTKTSPSTQTINGTVTSTNNSVGTDGGAAIGFDTQVGGIVSLLNPTYTAGNLNALSLTPAGGLRTANDGYVTTAAPTYSNNTYNLLSLDTSGNLRVLANQGTSPWVTSVTGTVVVTTNKGATSAVTSVAQSTSNTTILASNANRLIATIYNNTGQKMFIKLGTTANTTNSYTIPLMPNSYWEVPSDYTGEIDAIWMGSGSGSALVTEVTP